jgi:hypothetical protein
MKNKDFAQKYDIPKNVARLVREKGLMDVLVKSFIIIDIKDTKDPNVIKMLKFRKEHPEYEESYIRGMRDYFGEYHFFRKETDKEFERRILKDIELAKKRFELLKRIKKDKIFQRLNKKKLVKFNIMDDSRLLIFTKNGEIVNTVLDPEFKHKKGEF